MSLGRGINFGNALDALPDAIATLELAEHHFDVVADAGFDTVRLPVRWSGHAGESAPFRIDPDFFVRVDRAITKALRRDLNVVLNVHHYDELQAFPDQHEERFLALWAQISRRYADHAGRLYFELLNEPRDAMTAHRWNALFPRALAVIRESNPDRALIVGTVRMNSIDALPELVLPDDDQLIVTVHYYAPLAFTHQGADWVAGADRWLGTTWGDEADRNALRDDIAKVAEWAGEHHRPVFVGEFGAYHTVDLAARARWTAAVRAELERAGLSWAYWDFGTDFGGYDQARGGWREPLRQALLPAAGRFVSDAFVVPTGLAAGALRLEPLGPRHNEDDHAAWMSSIEHVRATPGFQGRDWPPPAGMSLADNLRDLQRHADDFVRRTGFTYTVIAAATGEVVGCVYIYPPRDGEHDADVRSWVRADKAELDEPLYQAVSAWLATDWPFRNARYAPR
jgi:endoglucanase